MLQCTVCSVLQIVFLQDTVRRECEERFELTEALGVAKEELMVLKRPPGEWLKLSVQLRKS